MADKYCDHGAYSQAQFVATLSSNTTMNVTSIVSGSLGVGSLIVMSGVSDGVYISGLGTGVGGVGTYTLSSAATITASGVSGTSPHGGLSKVPAVFGTAQEGDGTAPGLAVSATVSINFSSASAIAGNSISVMGATLTCVTSGATTNQFNAGTGTALIDAIVTSINGATVTIPAPDTGWGTPKLSDCVFARRNGNNLEIMTRAGSATYNGKLVAVSGFTGVTGPWAFAGGSGGVWGVFLSQYGPLPSQMNWSPGIYTAVRPTTLLAGAGGIGDTLHVRANNKAIWLASPNVNVYILFDKVLIDDGTVWSGDSGKILKIVHTGVHDGSRTFAFFASQYVNPSVVFAAKSKYGFIWEYRQADSYGVVQGYAGFSTEGNSSILVENIQVDSYFPLNGGPWSVSANGYGSAILRSSKLRSLTNAAPRWIVGLGSYSAVTYDDVVLEYPTYTGASFNLMPVMSSSYTNQKITLQRSEVSASVPVYASAQQSNVIAQNSTVIVDTVEGASLANNSGVFNSTAFYHVDEFHSRALQTNIGAEKAYRYETRELLVEWVPGQGFPTLNAYLYNGNPWSYSVMWGAIKPNRNLQALRLNKIVLASVAQVAVEILIPSALASLIETKDIGIVVSYQSESGLVVRKSFSPVTSQALAVGSNGWALNAYSSYVARKLVVALPSSPAIGAELEVELVLVNGLVSPQRIFVDPDVSLS